MTRLRIAPSPTGYPHIGTIWQALINYAYAQHTQGKFIVRIEDTDRQRLVADAEDKLFSALDWFGLIPDESVQQGGDYGPYRQSERLDLYKKYAQQLVDQGQAYYCFCSNERLDQVREKMTQSGRPPMYDQHCLTLKPEEVKAKLTAGQPHVIRLRVPKDQTIVVNDLLRGEIKFDSHVVDDQVLLKSDGFPTYHLAVVVDDHLMKITHIVRGEEWLSSAPKHVLLYDYLGWEKPVFIHTPILRNPDKSKLSKRQGHTQVSWYKDQGYLAEAILNFLSLLGWSHPQEKTIFSLDEFIKYFDLKDLSPVGPIVDLKKLDYINQQYIKALPDDKLAELLKDFVQPQLSKQADKLVKISPIIKERINKLTDAKGLTDFFVDLPDYDRQLLLYKDADFDLLKAQFDQVLEKLTQIDWQLDNITQTLRDICEQNDYHRGQFFMALRVAVTGSKISPPLFESMEILGQPETLSRLNTAIQKLQ